MRLREILIILLAISGVCVGRASRKVPQCGKRSVFDGNIFGGDHTEVNAWPWLVALRHNDVFFCAGSLVSTKHVVSGNKK